MTDEESVVVVEHLTPLYVNLSVEGASLVIRNDDTGQIMEIPGGPIEVRETI